MFGALSIVCDEYFLPSLEIISESKWLEISPKASKIVVPHIRGCLEKQLSNNLVHLNWLQSIDFCVSGPYLKTTGLRVAFLGS